MLVFGCTGCNVLCYFVVILFCPISYLILVQSHYFISFDSCVLAEGRFQSAALRFCTKRFVYRFVCCYVRYSNFLCAFWVPFQLHACIGHIYGKITLFHWSPNFSICYNQIFFGYLVFYSLITVYSRQISWYCKSSVGTSQHCLFNTWLVQAIFSGRSPYSCLESNLYHLLELYSLLEILYFIARSLSTPARYRQYCKSVRSTGVCCLFSFTKLRYSPVANQDQTNDVNLLAVLCYQHLEDNFSYTSLRDEHKD